MAQEQLTVVSKDPHSVNIYAAATGNLKRTVYVTSGEIVGQPVNNGDTCTITCIEGGRTMIAIYQMPNFTLKNKFFP